MAVSEGHFHRLAGTQVQDLAPLTALTSLEMLYLEGTQVQDLAPLAALTSLQRLGSQDGQRLDLEGAQVNDLAPLQGPDVLLTFYDFPAEH